MEQWLQTLPDLALFVEVVRTGSFRLAAARLGVPASTLSRRIAAMESRLSQRLLLRTTRSVTLAPAARAYYEQALQVVEAAERAASLLPGAPGAPGRLRIAMPVDLGVDVLGPVVARFVSARPGLQAEVDLSPRPADLLRDPVDLAFRVGKPMDDRVVARRLADIESALYAAPGFLRRAGPLTQASRLAQLPCLNLMTGQGPMAWAVGAHRWAAAPGPQVLSVNSVALLRNLAEQEHGIALLPVHIATPAVQAGRLQRVLPGEPTPVWPLYAVTAGRVLSPVVRDLIAHVKEALKQGALQRGPAVPRRAG